MNDVILKFLQEYKKLDELCKQILSSTRGISEYIDQMQSECRNHSKVPNWNNDLKELKRLRWIRNQLVHDTDSFDTLEVSKEDISYLKEFRSRILHCEDPFSLLHKLEQHSTHKNVKSLPLTSSVSTKNDACSDDTASQENSYSGILLLLVISAVFIFFLLYFFS